VTDIEVLSFSPVTDEPIHRVYFFPHKGRLKELKVIGVVLTRVTTLQLFTPVKEYKLSPTFTYKGAIVLGEDFWNEESDGGTLVVVAAGRGAQSRAIREYKRRTE
jgi:hypothetical protein